MKFKIEADGTRVVVDTGTYMDGFVYYGPEEFEAEHGVTFEEFCRVAPDDAVESEPAEFFEKVRKS